MKILHAISGGQVGGAEIAFERAATALVNEDLEQCVIIRANEGRRQRLEAAGLKPIELPFRPRLDFTSKRRLNAEISSFKPDILVTWTPDVSVQVAPFAGKHVGYIGRDFPATKIQSCDHLIACSQGRVDRITAAGWPKERISLLPQVICPDDIKATDRKDFFTPETAKLVVAVGNLDAENSFEILLEAVARISGLYLWVIGEGAAAQELEQKALEIGIKPRSRFVGWRYDALSLIGASDLVVCPARQDDLGTGVIESWACGKPVVAADSMGPGLLIRHRENGVLVPVDDTRSLAEAMKWVLQDKSFSDRIAAAGLDTFNQHHGVDTVVPMYLDVFERLVKAGDSTSPEHAQ